MREIIAAIVLLLTPAVARADANQWLDQLHADIADDINAGKPLVVQVHVPLCDNDVLVCGNDRLGNGDDPATNLYWATSGGFRGWFKQAPGWREVKALDPPAEPVLERRVWRRRIEPSAGLRRQGVKRAFDLYVVADAWRGERILDAMNAFASDLYGWEARAIRVTGAELSAGGAAHAVAFVGHNGWMDHPDFDWQRVQSLQPRRKGVIAIACLTESYLAGRVPAETRVPLLFTTSLMFAGAGGLEGAVTAFAEGQPLASIRSRAGENHARSQGRTRAAGISVFTNPADPRWLVPGSSSSKLKGERRSR